MQVISIPSMKEVITDVCVRQREPAMFWGKPGVGKSVGILLPIYRGPAVINIVIRTKI